MISIRHLWRKVSTTKWKWLWIALVSLSAMRLYYVQEMIAALLIFSVLFAAVSAVVLIIFLLDRASQQTVAWAEPGVGRLARWVAEALEGLIAASPVWAAAASRRFGAMLAWAEPRFSRVVHRVVEALEGVIVASPAWAEAASRRFGAMLAWAEPRISRVVHRAVEALEGVIAASPVWAAAASRRFGAMLAWAAPRISRVVHRVVEALEGVIVASPAWAEAVSYRFRMRSPAVKKARVIQRSSRRPRFTDLIHRQVRRIRQSRYANFI